MDFPRLRQIKTVVKHDVLNRLAREEEKFRLEHDRLELERRNRVIRHYGFLDSLPTLSNNEIRILFIVASQHPSSKLIIQSLGLSFRYLQDVYMNCIYNFEIDNVLDRIPLHIAAKWPAHFLSGKWIKKGLTDEYQCIAIGHKAHAVDFTNGTNVAQPTAVKSNPYYESVTFEQLNNMTHGHTRYSGVVVELQMIITDLLDLTMSQSTILLDDHSKNFIYKINIINTTFCDVYRLLGTKWLNEFISEYGWNTLILSTNEEKKSSDNLLASLTNLTT